MDISCLGGVVRCSKYITLLLRLETLRFRDLSSPSTQEVYIGSDESEDGVV